MSFDLICWSTSFKGKVEMAQYVLCRGVIAILSVQRLLLAGDIAKSYLVSLEEGSGKIIKLDALRIIAQPVIGA